MGQTGIGKRPRGADGEGEDTQRRDRTTEEDGAGLEQRAEDGAGR